MTVFEQNIVATARAWDALLESMVAPARVKPLCEGEEECPRCSGECPKTGQTKQQERED